MRLPKDESCQIVAIKRLIEGYYDDQNQWVEGGETIVATITGVDIQPKSGRERVATSGTAYESDYRMYAGTDDITFESGFMSLQTKDIVTDAAGNQYRIVFPGYWSTHYEADLKLEVGNEG